MQLEYRDQIYLFISAIYLSPLLRFLFNRKWGLPGKVSHTRMHNDARDSAIVEGVGGENQLPAIVQ